MVTEITKEKTQQIYNDLRSYYVTHKYNYEQIFIDSGDYDDIDKNVLYDFISPILEIIDSKGSEEFNRLYP